MMLCNHPDLDYKHACFEAYNRWIAGYCAEAPDRMLGCGQTALRTVDEGIADLTAIKDAGLRGVMMPGEPGTFTDDAAGDYDDPMWDPFWEAAVDLGPPAQLPHPHLALLRARRCHPRVRASTASSASSVASRTSWARWCSAVSSNATPG